MYIYVYWASLVSQTVKNPPAIIIFKEYMFIREHIFLFKVEYMYWKEPSIFHIKVSPSVSDYFNK